MMKFRKAYKVALKKECIENLHNYINDDSVEVQLLNIHDDLDLIDSIESKIVSIHAPLERTGEVGYTCNFSFILHSLYDMNYYYKYFVKMIEKAHKLECGIVVHCDVMANDIKGTKEFNHFLDLIKSYNCFWLFENITEELVGANNIIMQPVEVAKLINNSISENIAFPLLDICHWQMVKNRINCNYNLNLKDTISLYWSPKQFLHFCNAGGSGDESTGGKHGQNFSDNTVLLNELLDLLRNYVPVLVLENSESDFVNKPNARWLADKIEEYEKAN